VAAHVPAETNWCLLKGWLHPLLAYSYRIRTNGHAEAGNSNTKPALWSGNKNRNIPCGGLGLELELELAFKHRTADVDPSHFSVADNLTNRVMDFRSTMHSQNQLWSTRGTNGRRLPAGTKHTEKLPVTSGIGIDVVNIEPMFPELHKYIHEYSR